MNSMSNCEVSREPTTAGVLTEQKQRGRGCYCRNRKKTNSVIVATEGKGLLLSQ